MIVAGIDEAGLGPVLGPLVVSATSFDVPDELAGLPMWDILRPSVSRKPAKRAGGIAIADSKKLYSRQKECGIEHLERGVLTMLAARSTLTGPSGPPSPVKGEGQTVAAAPATLGQLLSIVAPGCLPHRGGYPWYSHADLAIPRTISATGVALAANALAAGMDKTDVKGPLTMRAEVVFESEYNRLVRATDNKSVTLFDIVSRLMMHLWQLSAGRDMKLVVDRQGGRMHYLQALQRLFDGCQFKILDEGETVSAYRIQDGRRALEVWFMVEAEDQHLPVALASMLAKYLREVLMETFNAYWAGHKPDLAPTAGYHTDGNRFFREITPLVQQMGIEMDRIFRSR